MMGTDDRGAPGICGPCLRDVAEQDLGHRVETEMAAAAMVLLVCTPAFLTAYEAHHGPEGTCARLLEAEGTEAIRSLNLLRIGTVETSVPRRRRPEGIRSCCATAGSLDSQRSESRGESVPAGTSDRAAVGRRPTEDAGRGGTNLGARQCAHVAAQRAERPGRTQRRAPANLIVLAGHNALAHIPPTGPRVITADILHAASLQRLRLGHVLRLQDDRYFWPTPLLEDYILFTVDDGPARDGNRSA